MRTIGMMKGPQLDTAVRRRSPCSGCFFCLVPGHPESQGTEAALLQASMLVPCQHRCHHAGPSCRVERRGAHLATRWRANLPWSSCNSNAGRSILAVSPIANSPQHIGGPAQVSQSPQTHRMQPVQHRLLALPQPTQMSGIYCVGFSVEKCNHARMEAWALVLG